MLIAQLQVLDYNVDCITKINFKRYVDYTTKIQSWLYNYKLRLHCLFHNYNFWTTMLVAQQQIWTKMLIVQLQVLDYNVGCKTTNFDYVADCTTKIQVLYYTQFVTLVQFVFHWIFCNPGGLDSWDQSRSRSRTSFVSRLTFLNCRDFLDGRD
jgi:hypothetical protein